MEKIDFKSENGTLVLYLKGRVDSSNATNIDREIEDVRTSVTHDKTIIDVNGLEYVSSAGLRVILRLLKLEPNLKIINASNDIYEIFQMTGFTEMMKVEKAFREISILGAEIIGKGANGLVYRTSPDTIVKVYLNPDSLSDIEREVKMARRAFILGIPTAIPFDIVKVGDGYGSVFEMLDADSFLKCVLKDPKNIDKYIKLSVELMKKIHNAEVKPDEMPNQKDVVMGWVEFAKDYLSKEKYQKLFELVKGISNTNHIIHGDLHFKNILMQNNEVLLIDMDTLSRGNPIFEFSGLYDAYVGFSLFDHDNIKQFLGLSFEEGNHVWNKTLEYYFGTEDKDKLLEIEKKVGVISSLRLFRHIIYKGMDKEEKYQKQKEMYLAKLNFLLDEVDDLSI